MFRTLSAVSSAFVPTPLGSRSRGSLFEADVKDLFRNAAQAGGITQLSLSLDFNVSNTLAKVLGLRDI